VNLPVHHDEGFEHELKRQTLISERRRAVVLVWILSVILALLGIYQGVFGLRNDELPGRSYTLVTLGGWIGLEWLTTLLVSQHISDGEQRGPFRAYASAALEIAMPTMAMFMMCHNDSPLNVLTSSANSVYFLIIILSPLRLDVWKLGVQQPLPSPINEKRVAEEYATTSMSIVMATMARSMPQFGLLTRLIVLPMQNAICWCHAAGEHAQVRAGRNLTGTHHSFRLRLSGQSLSWRAST
jgi:hypothetical protein